MTNKELIVATVAIFVGFTSSSCVIVKNSETKNDKKITKVIEISDFNSINNNFVADIIYKEGPASLTISGSEYLISKTDIQVKDSMLVIDGKVDKIKNHQEIDIVCSSPNLRSVIMNGMGDFKWDGGTAADITMTMNGMGDIEWNDGRCNSLNMVINGMGDIDCKNISGNVLKGKISGHGDITVSGSFASGTLDVEGMGDINIKELNCPNLNTSVDGLGSIKRK